MKSFTPNEVAQWVGGQIANLAVLGSRVDQIRIERPSELGVSQPNHIAFFFSRSYQAELLKAAPGILITGEPFVAPLEASGLPLWKNSAVIDCPDPYVAMAVISKHLAPGLSGTAFVGRSPGKTTFHPTSVVDPDAEIAEGVFIGPHCVVEAGVKIGRGSRLMAGCFVGEHSKIGEDTVLFPHVTLYEFTVIGDRVRLHAGVVIGADGFGYAPRREGKQVVSHEKIYHLGRVVIGNDVEIGANSCVDRGTIGDTVIKDMAKIDDLVMIGHNCRLDTGAVICGNAGLAGRAKIGKFAYVGGGAGVGNDVEVGDGAMLGGHAVVSSDVEAGAGVLGSPARESRQHYRIQAMLNKMLAEREKRRKE